ncbi:ABC transporter permease [Bifidobacterium callitrichos]|uniref:Saly-type abc antimicrobial peptide transport system permease component n=1 Tax=Bifidobacterium callitrichos DSM 23973 TaxID=1437609 RepID=A0A087A5C2_9BIFI|nr:FtsX-like permease family protein [Bifidobacterium callitrichos]KFI53972.1 saly-type abc antimicrobial peptide transport system permease component [Bifidobacterium callitrichos DSM 23973]
MTNTGMFFRMLFGAVFRRRSRAIMAVVASLVGAATLFCLAAICIAVPQQMNDEMRAYGANLIVTPTGETDDSSSSDSAGSSAAKSGIDAAMVKHTTEMVRAKGSAKYATYRYENVRVNAAPYVMAGVDPAQVENLNHHWNVEGSWPTDGKVLIGRDVADALNAKIGGGITIGYRASDNASSSSASAGTSSSSSAQSGATDSSSSAPSDEGAGSANAETGGETSAQPTQDGRVSSDIMDTKGTEFRVAGIVDTGGSEDSIIYATNADVDKLTGVTRGVDVIEYSASASGDDLAATVKSINDMTSMHVKAQQVTKITSSDTRIITMLQTLFWIVSIVVLVLTLVGVSTTISSIVSQRSYEIGLRKALGASSASIGVEFYVESALYGLIGGLIGTGIGYALARVLTGVVFQRSLPVNWPLAIGSVLFSALIAVLASIPPVSRASRIDPAIVLREE